MRSLIERHGGRALIAPSMREIPLRDNQAALDAIRQLIAGSVDLLILLTGVGTEAMVELARSAGCEQRLLDRMAKLPIIVRGPKPVAVIRRLDLEAAIRADQPNTWREVVSAIDADGMSLQGKTVALQEYGVSSPELAAALQDRGASVLPIPVYRWDLPEDLEPLRSAIRAAAAGNTDLTLFTSAQQVRHVLQVADQLRLREAWLQSVPRVASIGPACSETLRESCVNVWFEADPSKMGSLVRGAIERFSAEC